ncbi:MAG: Plug domain-containing protein, partial [Yersiniaceae bacterium]|nr:Plug domain-containing protein [Yersiniaceae bacterium]
MKTFKHSGIGLAVISALLPYVAQAAESTDVGNITVEGQSLGGGMMVQEETPKARSTLTKEAMDKQPGAGNAIDKLQFTPGLNVNSTDSSGLSGFDYTMRGLKSDQIGMSIDGIPM